MIAGVVLRRDADFCVFAPANGPGYPVCAMGFFFGRNTQFLPRALPVR